MAGAKVFHLIHRKAVPLPLKGKAFPALREVFYERLFTDKQIGYGKKRNRAA